MLTRLSASLAALVLLSAPALAQDFPLTIQHAKGATEVAAPAQRVVVFSEEFIETAVALDVPLVAVGLWRTEVPDGPYTKLPYLDQPVLGEPAAFDGFEVNYEGLLALEPDLIVYHLDADEANDPIFDKLTTIAPTVAFIGTKPGEWKEVTHALGNATGRKAKADAVIADYDARVAALRTQMAPIVAAHPTVTAIFAFGDNTGYFNDQHNIGGHLATLGFKVTSPLGDAIEPSGFSVASPETVSQIDADTIFVYRRTESTFDEFLKRRPQPVVDLLLPPGIGHTGPLTELYYLDTIASEMGRLYGK